VRQRTTSVLRPVAGAIVGIALVGCGGGGHKAATTTTASTPAAERAAVASVWTRFFAGSTPAAQKVALLENGRAFAKAIQAQASSPLAKGSSAKVNRVALLGPAKASVVYTIDLGGKPALENQRGIAVKVGGAWKVGAASFCVLLRLQGNAPKACSGASS